MKIYNFNYSIVWRYAYKIIVTAIVPVGRKYDVLYHRNDEEYVVSDNCEINNFMGTPTDTIVFLWLSSHILFIPIGCMGKF